MKKNFCFLALLLSAAGAFAQDTLQTSASVVKILSEDLVDRSVVVAVDLSASTLKEDIAAVSKIIFTRETQKFQLLDLGTGGDVQAGDGIFTATFPWGDKSSVDEVRAQLTTAPFTFNLISDFGANPPVTGDHQPAGSEVELVLRVVQRGGRTFCILFCG